MSSGHGPSYPTSNTGVLLALDVGTVRVGIACYKAECVLPLETVERSKGQAEKRILEVIEAEQVSSLVVGLPLNENGELTTECESIQSFCRRLVRRADVEIIYVDEYGSSAEAKHRLEQEGQIDDQKAIDAVAAAVILQSYLDGEKVVSKLTSAHTDRE